MTVCDIGAGNNRGSEACYSWYKGVIDIKEEKWSWVTVNERFSRTLSITPLSWKTFWKGHTFCDCKQLFISKQLIPEGQIVWVSNELRKDRAYLCIWKNNCNVIAVHLDRHLFGPVSISKWIFGNINEVYIFLWHLYSSHVHFSCPAAGD